MSYKFRKFLLIHFIHFSAKSGRLSSTGFEILAFGSHCSANFRSRPILDCLTPKFNLKYDDLENIKIDRVYTVIFNSHQIKQLKFFGGQPIKRKNFLEGGGDKRQQQIVL